MDCNGHGTDILASYGTERRSSARIQKLKSEKALRVRPEVKEEPENKKNFEVLKKRKVEKANVGSEVVENGLSKPEAEVEVPNEKKESVEGGQMVVIAENGTTGVEKSAYARVTDTLRTFNKHYLHFVQEEEKRCRKVEADKNKAKSPKKKKGDALKTIQRIVPAPDLKAISKARVDVGHQFFSRAEMVAVGFHSHWLNGIDFVGQSASKLQEFSGNILPLTVAIVLSGQYEDDLDNCEDVIYTGQGGNNLLGDKRQIRDQVMLRGNLGLKNCMEQSVPVRVIRGHQCKSSYVGKVYTYDGLYTVIRIGHSC